MVWEIKRAFKDIEKETNRVDKKEEEGPRSYLATYSSFSREEKPEKRRESDIFLRMYDQDPLVGASIDKLVAGCAGDYYFAPKKIVKMEEINWRNVEYLELFAEDCSPMADELSDLLEDLFFDLFVFGEGFWEIKKNYELEDFLKQLNNKKKAIETIDPPIYIYPISSDTMSIVSDPKGRIEGYKQRTTKGEEVDFMPEEVIHFRLSNPSKSLSGVSPLKSLQNTVAASLYLGEYNASFFENNATPRLHIDLGTQAKQADLDRFVAKAESELKGHPHKNLVTTGGTTVNPIGISNKDMEFGNLDRSLRDKTIAKLGAQPIVLGMVEDANRANATVQLALFKSLTLEPRRRLVARRINKLIVSKFLGIKDTMLKFREVDRLDLIEKSNIDKNDLQWGIKTVNELRAERGLRPVTWGEQPFYPIPSLQGLTTQPKPKEEK